MLFGIGAFVWPGVTIQALVLLFGAYALLDGLVATVVGMQHRGDNQRWWVVVLEGGAGIALGVLTWMWPGTTATVLLAFIATWAMVTGTCELVAAIELRRVIAGAWTLLLAGALSVLLGLLVVLQPEASAVAISWMIGAYAIAVGTLFIILAFRLRTLGHAIDQALPGAV